MSAIQRGDNVVRNIGIIGSAFVGTFAFVALVVGALAPAETSTPELPIPFSSHATAPGYKPAPAPVATPAPPKPKTTCKADWTQCADNSDMANNWEGWTRASVDCKYAANDRAKYATEWPWLVFTSFYPGTDYSSGTATLVESHAKFQNGFGAMARVKILCKYDLHAKKVTDVIILQ